jgi:sucrose phosphorylase
MIKKDVILNHLKAIYPQEDVKPILKAISKKIQTVNERLSEMSDRQPDIRLDNADNVILITYADSLLSDEPALKTLRRFLTEYVGDDINTVHLLPFFPYSSDDGFSVKDYQRVNPHCGDWEDIRRLARDKYLMFDGVINHCSKESDWFQQYLSHTGAYDDFFIQQDPDTDLSSVVRPRALPLLTPFQTQTGEKYLWTTFSEDQIDLNYKNPNVLLTIIDVLLFYVLEKASLIRLDAIGYLWKEIGTPCIHLPQTHAIIKLFRAVLESLDQRTLIITETNVPHQENISYFGNGYDEAHMVYNFSLPPLVLNAFQSHSSKVLNQWADQLFYPTVDANHQTLQATYFNFLASHDGIGLMPARGLLNEEEITKMMEKTLKNGGEVSYKSDSDGKQSPYELNISFFDALYESSESMESNIRKFLCAYSIAFSLKGIPGVYIHSLIGSRNWIEGLKKGHNRSINREKISYASLKKELALHETISKGPQTMRSRIFHPMKTMLKTRKRHPAFKPSSKQDIVKIDERLFILKRQAQNETIYCLANLSPESIDVGLQQAFHIKKAIHLITGQPLEGLMSLSPYDYAWISPL